MTGASGTVHTATTRTKGGREHGVSRSSDGHLDIMLAPPGSGGIGTNPEQLFAAAWSASLEHEIRLAARARKIDLPAVICITAVVTLGRLGAIHRIAALLTVCIPSVDRSVAQSLVDDAHRACPYSQATRGNIDVAIELPE